MAQHWIDAADLTDLTGFAQFLGTGVTASLVDDSGQAILIASLTNNTQQSQVQLPGVSYATAGVQRIAALVRQNRATNFRGCGIATHVENDGGNCANGCGFSRAGSGGTPHRLLLLPTAQVTDISSVTVVTAYHWISLVQNGADAEGRVWTGEITDEPSTASTSGTSASWTTNGHPALFMYQNSGDEYYIKKIAVATEGDPLPTGPVGGTRRRSPLLLTPW